MPMKFAPSIKSFRCYLQACEVSIVILWSVAFHYASFLEWINKGNIVLMFSYEKCIPALLPISYRSFPTEGICSGSEFSGWSTPVSFMLVLVILSLHRNLSFFIELFQHIVYGWIVMLLYAQRYFLQTTCCC